MNKIPKTSPRKRATKEELIQTQQRTLTLLEDASDYAQTLERHLKVSSLPSHEQQMLLPLTKSLINLISNSLDMLDIQKG